MLQLENIKEDPIYNSYKREKIPTYIPNNKLPCLQEESVKIMLKNIKKMNKWTEEPYS